jgi:hypothetical protein
VFLARDINWISRRYTIVRLQVIESLRRIYTCELYLCSHYLNLVLEDFGTNRTIRLHRFEEKTSPAPSSLRWKLWNSFRVSLFNLLSGTFLLCTLCTSCTSCQYENPSIPLSMSVVRLSLKSKGVEVCLDSECQAEFCHKLWHTEILIRSVFHASSYWLIATSTSGKRLSQPHIQTQDLPRPRVI